MASSISKAGNNSEAAIIASEIDFSSQTSQHARDDDELIKLGKKPVLKRDFGFFSMIGLVCTLMVSWEGTLLLLAVGLFNGGFAGSVYAYLFVWFGVITTSATMAELASMAPTAGGQYHWVHILAPARFRNFFSYLIGWLITIGWQAGTASGTYLGAQLFQGLAVMGNPDYVPKPWQTMLVFWAVMAFAAAMNTFSSRFLSHIESASMILHVVGFVVTLVVLAALAPHGDATQIFTEFMNGGNFPNMGISFLVGALGPAFVLLGPDGPVHLSEEIPNSARNVPTTIVVGAFLNGGMGFAMLIVALFGIGDVDAVLASPTGYPFMAIYEQATNNIRGAQALAAIVTIMIVAAVISYVATTSRMLWSFARDQGVPGWSFLKIVEPRTSLPLYSIALTAFISILLSLIQLGSSVALNDVVALSITGMYASYIAGNGLLLYRRVTGQIYPLASAEGMLRNTPGCDKLTWGPWRIPEPWGTINNALGLAYMIIIFFFSFWPSTMDPTPSQMNWSSVMLVAIVVIALVYYLIFGRKSYKGPVIEIDLS